MEKGLTDTAETLAYPYVYPYATHRNSTALLRAAAITAKQITLPQYEEDGFMPLGRSFALMSRNLQGGKEPDPEDPTIFDQRLSSLPQYGLDEAALTIDRLLTYGAKTGVPVDYYNLTRTLIYWGGGISKKSVDHRRKVLRDFYLPLPNRNAKQTKETQPKES